MKVPFTVSDFLYRAENVYPDRVALADEPEAPGGGLGEITYARFGELVRAQAAKLDQLGIGHGERVAMVSQNAGRLMTSFYGVSGYGRIFVPINFRLSHDEISYIIDHCGATMLLVDPSMEDTCKDIDVEHFVVMGTDADDQLATPRPAGVTGSAFRRCQNSLCVCRGCRRDWAEASLPNRVPPRSTRAMPGSA